MRSPILYCPILKFRQFHTLFVKETPILKSPLKRVKLSYSKKIVRKETYG
jgi:hypothetical protein